MRFKVKTESGKDCVIESMRIDLYTRESSTAILPYESGGVEVWLDEVIVSGHCFYIRSDSADDLWREVCP